MRQQGPKRTQRNFSVRVPKQEADAFERLARERDRPVAAELRRLMRREVAEAEREAA